MNEARLEKLRTHDDTLPDDGNQRIQEILPKSGGNPRDI